MTDGPIGNALVAYTLAKLQAERLAPAGVAPQFLAEAIWLRALAVGAPTDEQVVEYLARCAADHRPVSGRTELEPGISPLEIYTVTGGATVHVRRKGRSDYTATVASPEHVEILSATLHEGTTAAELERFGVIATAKSRAKIHRKVEECYPGGRWSSRLLSSEVAEIRKRWGLADDDANA